MKLSEELLNPLLGLLFRCNRRNQTISVEFVENKDGHLRILVPEQTATGCSTNANLKLSCDLISGEIFSEFPPKDYRHVGGAYCHNTMGVFFSGTTDASELLIPGIHLCFGNFNREQDGYYEILASEVKARQRYSIPIASIIDSADPITSLNKRLHRNSLCDKSQDDIGFGIFIPKYPYHKDTHNLIHSYVPKRSLFEEETSP